MGDLSSLRLLAEFISLQLQNQSPLSHAGWLLVETACNSSGLSLQTLSQHGSLLLQSQQRRVLYIHFTKTESYKINIQCSQKLYPITLSYSIIITKSQARLTFKEKENIQYLKTRNQGSLGINLKSVCYNNEKVCITFLLLHNT